MQDKLDSDKEQEQVEVTQPIPEEPEQLQMGIDHPDFLKPQRLEGESNYQYKLRRFVQKKYTESAKKGKFMWIAKDVKHPVYAEDDIEMKGKPIGFTVSRGFTYNKKKVEAALEEYKRKKEETIKQIDSQTDKTEQTNG